MAELLPTKIFLSKCNEHQSSFRSDLESVLKSAGMHVFPFNGIFSDSDLLLISQDLSFANCSIHILFPHFSPVSDSGISAAKHQFFEAKKKLDADPSFKIFVWLPPSTDPGSIEAHQLDFINEVKNNISKNMVFSNASSAIQLADDIRSLMEVKEQVFFDLNSTDIFLISIQLDEIEANDIIDMLSDIVPVEKLNIIQDSDVDYSELCKQQISKSKLAVIYFKESAEWALPFAQQVWKKIGGATTHTPILLIGDEDPDTNTNKKFMAPKVISLIVSGELIPLEIKVQYDKVAAPKL
jgi:hypothetical protein